MKIEIKIPSPGESIEELELVEWLVADGSTVEKDQELATLESEKASLILVASSTGVIHILLKAPALVKVGSTACVIDEAKIPASGSNLVQKSVGSAIISESHVEVFQAESKTRVSPVARKLAELNAIDIEKLAHQGDRISKADVVKAMRRKSTESREEKVPMSQLRKKLSEKLVSVQLNTAMLTTFNEVDMFPVLELRKMYGEKFLAQYGVKLGLMSFFTKAVALALNDYRNVNAAISGNDLVFYKYADIGIAVQTDKGLMVPVLRDVQDLNLPEIEQQIFLMAEKARNARISLDDLKGGTFTITNGGVFGSLLSTPIINPPQSAILGMHTIQERPVVRDAQIVIRPMMYVALSYDHRIIDGRDSVGFLKTVKNLIENPKELFDFGSLGS